jgi:hypothetical protein
MIEVMLIGVLVALTKIADYATVIPGVALFALVRAGLPARRHAVEFRSARSVGPGQSGRMNEARRPDGRPADGGGDIVTAHATGLAELRHLRTALATRARCGRGTLPALRRGARLPQAGQPPAHPGLPDRRGGLLCSSQRPAGDDHCHGLGPRIRHHPAGRRAPLVADRLAALAHRAVCQHHDSQREDCGIALPARHRAAGLDREQPPAHPALPDRRDSSDAGPWWTCLWTPSPWP